MKGALSVAAVVVIGLITCLGLITMHWEEIDKREAAFAKECNNRGAIAKRYDGILQCVRP